MRKNKKATTVEILLMALMVWMGGFFYLVVTPVLFGFDVVVALAIFGVISVVAGCFFGSFLLYRR